MAHRQKNERELPESFKLSGSFGRGVNSRYSVEFLLSTYKRQQRDPADFVKILNVL